MISKSCVRERIVYECERVVCERVACEKVVCNRVVCEKVARERVVCEKAGLLLPTLGQSRPPKRRGGE
jgi:hypothetical protein